VKVSTFKQEGWTENFIQGRGGGKRGRAGAIPEERYSDRGGGENKPKRNNEVEDETP